MRPWEDRVALKSQVVASGGTVTFLLAGVMLYPVLVGVTVQVPGASPAAVKRLVELVPTVTAVAPAFVSLTPARVTAVPLALVRPEMVQVRAWATVGVVYHLSWGGPGMSRTCSPTLKRNR